MIITMYADWDASTVHNHERKKGRNYLDCRFSKRQDRIVMLSDRHTKLFNKVKSALPVIVRQAVGCAIRLDG